MMKNTKIGFIGGGNMAQAIIGGLVKAGVPSAHIYVSDIDLNKLSTAFAGTDVQLGTDNAVVMEHCEVVVLAVKPQMMKSVLQALSSHVAAHQPLLISIAAGITLSLLHSWISSSSAIVRVMPNTPALVSAGASGLFANTIVSATQRALAEQIMDAVGVTTWVNEEHLIDTVTAVSGGGPAYFFYMIEALEQAAFDHGLSADDARLLSIETALGAAKLAAQSDVPAAELRQRVTSSGGTTAAAIAELEAGKFAQTIKAAVDSAVSRGRELAQIAESQ